MTSEILLVFDADYTPGPGLIKQLVAPFLDPEVGAVMGRVVPLELVVESPDAVCSNWSGRAATRWTSRRG